MIRHGGNGKPAQISFSTTQWSLVVAAGGADDSDAREALTALCERYWFPIYVQVRRTGYDPDAAQDLTQGFFAHVLEKRALRVATPERGRFRAFLKGSLRHYLSNARHHDLALKRGGGMPHVALELDDAEARFRQEPGHRATPEVLFEKAWAREVLLRALERVRIEAASSTSSRRRFALLEPFLTSSGPSLPTYKRVADQLGMSETAVKVAVHRLRGRFGEALRAEIAGTVKDPGEVDDEIRYLMRVVRPDGSGR